MYLPYEFKGSNITFLILRILLGLEASMKTKIGPYKRSPPTNQDLKINSSTGFKTFSSFRSFNELFRTKVIFIKTFPRKIILRFRSNLFFRLFNYRMILKSWGSLSRYKWMISCKIPRVIYFLAKKPIFAVPRVNFVVGCKGLKVILK